MGFGNKKIRLNVFDTYKQFEFEDCSQIKVVDEIIEETTPAVLCWDPLQKVISKDHPLISKEIEGGIPELEELLGIHTESLSPPWTVKVDPAPEVGTSQLKPSILGPNDMLPIIISSALFES